MIRPSKSGENGGHVLNHVWESREIRPAGSLKLTRSLIAVSIAPETEVISPLILGNHKNVEDLDLDPRRSPRKASLVKTTSSKRLFGRPPSIASPAIRPSSGLYASSELTDDKESSNGRHSQNHLEQLIDQVSEWVKLERTKHEERKTKRKGKAGDGIGTKSGSNDSDHDVDASSKRRGSDTSEKSFDLDKLEDIIKHNLSLERRSRRSPVSLRRRGSLRKPQRKQSSASSDTDYFESEVLVPSSDVVLDNSKTLAYTGGASDDSDVSSGDEMLRTGSYRDQDAWTKFKFEIVRLTHTLRLKGWRRVPMEMSNEITVQRLSGALTNAVYVVSPPMDLPPREDGNRSVPAFQKPPPKLLLRIYGPQADHLIDRQAELAILRRLARKSIGPRLLGTFANGRFEEFFYAKTLTAEDLRNSGTSRQIAKRMRELHDGIELLDQERDDGAFVWRNWDKWVQRVGQVVSWLDCEVMKLKPGANPTGPEGWKRRGFICGVPWKQFRDMVEKYRYWLEGQYGGRERIRQQLVFAHNDTQYGNILRLMPTGESPLLLPANTHKQLVVIDFEYASANLAGLEFANHFTEWSYNYHDAWKPYAFHPKRYPTPEEQDRFIRAYVRHRPQFNVSTPKLAPTASTTPPVYAESPGQMPSRKPTSSISSFMLDARAPSNRLTEEAAQNTAEDQEVARLMHETRIWRLANTAQWVAWGIVQAKVHGMPDFSSETKAESGPNGDEETRQDLGERAEEYRELSEQDPKEGEDSNGLRQEEAEEEFDYLGYAQHRAMFFWADALQLGLTKAEELPEEIRGKLKRVPY